ncbi:hypothetical protein MYAM1_002307 [Malassezia yamatoensis]|uniref:Threonine/serine exporter-like N-terminal domain-containing protein n=1 Tax=Malassezia yamatoensis TaxID=253288 RepID=A0AAJ5YXR1_9BASI|nr:hypothetical protein MYAM1_002307 [Malassezia yamatoensis]
MSDQPIIVPAMEGAGDELQEADVIQAYSMDDTLASKQPPSYETEDSNTQSFYGIADQSTTQEAPPIAMASEPISSLAQPVTLPVQVDADPLTRPVQDYVRRVRWGEDTGSAQARAPSAQTRQRPRGPTVSVKPAPQISNSSAPLSPTSSGGIKRSNHPGQIDLGNLRPSLPTETIPMEPLNNDHTNQSTGAMALDGEDNDRFMLLSRELNQLDEDDAEGQSNDGVVSRANTHTRELPRHHEQDHLMGIESGRLTPGSMSDSSYDPAEELDHLDLIEGETDGMPSMPKRSKSKRQREPFKRERWTKVRNLFRINASDTENDDDVEKGAMSADATNTKSVPVHTSTGLRGTQHRYRPSALERKAAKLVRTHNLYRRHSVRTPDADEMLRVKQDHLPSSEASTPDAVETAEKLDARPAPSNGVLGQLLQLYEQQRLEQEAAHGMPEDSNSVSDVEAVTNPDTLHENHRLSDATMATNLLDTPSAKDGLDDSSGNRLPAMTPGGRHYFASGYRPGVTPGSTRTGRMASAGLNNVGNMSQKIVKGVAAEAGLDMDERPKASRSAAGVMGALIATSGNLIGAVSPSHAQLGPNPTRSGYKLDRYLLPEMNEKTLRRTAKIVRDAAPVPKSMRSNRMSQVGTPGLRTPGIYTPGIPTGGSNENFNPYFAAACNQEKSGSASVSSPTSHSKSNRFGSDYSQASKRVSQIGQAGKNMFRDTSRAISTGASDSVGDRNEYFGDAATQEQIAKREWQKKLRKRKASSKKQEIYITMHVAAILKRQEFLLKFARAMMMFGAPTHRIESQMQQTANVLDVNCRCIYLPNLMLLSFGDDATHTTDTRFIKQTSTLDLTKLTDMHSIYWNVIHDKIGVERGTKQLDTLMRRKPYFRRWHQTLIGALASFFITLGEMGFGGSFLDALAAMLLGGFLVFCQQQITSEIYSNVFEIVFATLNSFVAMALHMAPAGGEGSKSGNGELFCYNSIISGSIVLILPGFIVLSGALELQAKSIISGSVRLVYAIIYSVLLGIGIKFGSIPISAMKLDENDANYSLNTCVGHDTGNHWYTHILPKWWGFLSIPCYAIMLSCRSQAKLPRKEFPVMVAIACAGYAVANFAKLINMNDIGTQVSSTASYLTKQIALVGAMGSFTVGLLSNLYGRLFDGRTFVVAVPGILLQLPTGLASSGNTNFISYAQSNSGNATTSSSSEVTDGLNIGAQLLNVSLGMTIGLFCATMVMHIIGGRRARAGGLFSF